MSRRLLLLALAWGASVAQLNSEDSFKMPEGFLFGGGSASYQTEGGWNAAGKGVSVFDHYFHQAFPNKTSADVTCDFFHRYKEDLKIAADLKFNVFRFSISWTRLFPRGNISEVNQAGVQFYHDLINEIVAHKMRPLCTIYHFDHPQAYEDEFSGWQSEKMIEKYLEYAKFVLREFGDKVDFWTSINEPNMYCSLVYNGIMPPGMPGQLDSQKVYKCIHNEIIAHAKAFRYYKEEYPKITGRTTGMFGISATSMMARPQTTGFDDIYAAYKTNMFDTSMVLHPVVFGEYPPVVRATLEAQGRGNELPTFTAEEQKIVKGSIDYIGLNAFTGRMVAASAADGHPSDPLLASLVGPLSDHGAADVSGSSLVTPWILRDITLWIKEIYGVKVFITENGLSTPGKKVDDWNMRAVYHSMYLRELFRTINVDGANVFGYTVWSFLDAYEFANAFESEDGLIYIDHDDPSLQRTPKKSAEYLKNVAEQRYAAPLSASAAHQYDAYTLLTALVTYWLCRVTAPLLS